LNLIDRIESDYEQMRKEYVRIGKNLIDRIESQGSVERLSEIVEESNR